MAIVRLPLKFGLGYGDLYGIAEAAGLDDHACDEVAESWDMVQIWQDWFTGNFGEIVEVRHRSQGQDPPDLELVFAGQTVGMEHTRLLPEHLGQYNALRRKFKGFTSVPPISQKPMDFAERRDAMAWTEDNWVNVEDEWRALYAQLEKQLRGKMDRMSGGIIGMVVHFTLPNDEDQPWIAKVAQNIIDQAKFADFAEFTLILLARKYPSFHSSLIMRGEEVQERKS